MSGFSAHPPSQCSMEHAGWALCPPATLSKLADDVKYILFSPQADHPLVREFLHISFMFLSWNVNSQLTRYKSLQAFDRAEQQYAADTVLLLEIRGWLGAKLHRYSTDPQCKDELSSVKAGALYRLHAQVYQGVQGGVSIEDCMKTAVEVANIVHAYFTMNHQCYKAGCRVLPYAIQGAWSKLNQFNLFMIDHSFNACACYLRRLLEPYSLYTITYAQQARIAIQFFLSLVGQVHNNIILSDRVSDINHISIIAAEFIFSRTPIEQSIDSRAFLACVGKVQTLYEKEQYLPFEAMQERQLLRAAPAPQAAVAFAGCVPESVPVDLTQRERAVSDSSRDSIESDASCGEGFYLPSDLFC